LEKQITFESEGKKLFGVLHLSDKKKSPGIVLFHGFSGQKAESHFIFTHLARFLCKEGISVLRFDFMGSGDSEGEFVDKTLLTEMKDGENAVNYLRGLKEIDKNRIGVLGLSLGGVTAVYTASKLNIKSLCLWSGLAYPSVISRQLTRKLKKQLEEEGKAYLTGTGLIISKDFVESLKNIKPLEFAKQFKGNVLIIHCKDDTVLSLTHPLAYFENFHYNARFSELVIFEKGKHTFVIEKTEKDVLETTLKFFKETL